MLNDLSSPQKLRTVLLHLAIGFMAYQFGRNVPDMITISLGTWIQIAFSVLPGIILVTIITLWNPSEQILRLGCPRLPSFKSNISKSNSFFILLVSVICGLITFWLIIHFILHQLIGQAVLFGSMFLMLVLGIVK